MRGALRAFEAAATWAVLGGAVAIAFDRLLALPAPARWTVLAALGATSLAVLLYRLSEALAGASDLYLAYRVEAARPSLAGRLITAVELAGSEDEDVGPARLAVKQAEELIEDIRPREVLASEPAAVPEAKTLLASLLFALVVAVALGRDFSRGAVRLLFPGLGTEAPRPAVVAVLPGDAGVREGERLGVRAFLIGPAPEEVALLVSPDDGAEPVRLEMSRSAAWWTAEAFPPGRAGTYRVVARYEGEDEPRLESREYVYRVLVAPGARRIGVRYTYPEYARLPPRRGEGGVIDALVGTRAGVELEADEELEGARIVLEGGRSLAMRASGGSWSAELTVVRSGTYTIEMLGSPVRIAGRTGPEKGLRGRAGPFPVIARPDRAPKSDAAYREAEPEAVLSGGASFQVSGSDDIGLAELALVVKGGGKTFVLPVPGRFGGLRRFEAEVSFPPQVLPLEAGLTYTYYLRASDTRPERPNISTSPARTFRIEPPDRLAGIISGKKRRPPLLEPPDDEPEEPLGPRAGGAGSKGGDPGGRRLARLIEADGEKGGRPPRDAGSKKKEKPPSPYEHGPGLKAPDGQGRDEKKEKTGEKGGSPGMRRGPGELPGQGEKGASGGTPTASRGEGRGRGRSSRPGRPGTTGGGRQASGTGGGRRPGGGGGTPGGGRAPSDRTRTAGEGGSGSSSGRQVPGGGGVPTGDETGDSAPIPETVDRRAVDDLAVRPEEVEGMEVRTPSSASAVSAGRDLGTGVAVETGPLDGSDRIGHPPAAGGPPPGDAASIELSRAYRALLREYFRRLPDVLRRFGAVDRRGGAGSER